MRGLLIVIVLIAFLSSCRKTETSQLDSTKLTNVLDRDTNVTLFTVRSTTISPNPSNLTYKAVVTIRFSARRDLLNPEGQATNVIVFRDSIPEFKLDMGNDTIFTDYNVNRGQTYKYTFAFWSASRDTSKQSEPHEVVVPW
jgi:hypothetical protein